MAQPNSRQELIDYCKRKLGAPVLEINVADEQIDDLVDDAVQFFQERHFDGVSQMFLKYQITQDDINRGRAPAGEVPSAGIAFTSATANIAGTATTFTYREKDEMESNLKGLTLDEYLNLQDYHPVSSEEFIQRFDLDVDSTNPEEGKKVAFKNFVERVVEQITSVVNNSDFEGISIGFSDDDEGNVKIIEKLIEEELKKLYPKINFIIYDTSDPKNPKKKRIFIKK
jgi:hypothetical protein